MYMYSRYVWLFITSYCPNSIFDIHISSVQAPHERILLCFLSVVSICYIVLYAILDD